MKIFNACKQAERDGFEYIWIDTCCIDKSSSAELSEAINSMYRWYQESAYCYVYLSDVSIDQSIGSASMRTLASSRWFTRGWTLQELLAPSSLGFYDKAWTSMGKKLDLCKELSRISQIPEGIINGLEDVSSFSVAKRMSWASLRSTTRVEDLAYCLLGLFGVNMPLIYGEGEKAFERLQLEIMKSSSDQSLFVWDRCPDDLMCTGFFAKRPAQFKNSWDVIQSENWAVKASYECTNRGVRITLPLIFKGPEWADKRPSFCSAILACNRESDRKYPLAVPLLDTSTDCTQFTRNGDIYIHNCCESLVGSVVREIHINVNSGSGKNGPRPNRDSALDSEVRVVKERVKTLVFAFSAFCYVYVHIKLDYRQKRLSLKPSSIVTSVSVWILLCSIIFLMRNWPASDGAKIKFWTNSAISKQEKRMHRFLVLPIVAITFKALPSAVASSLVGVLALDQALTRSSELDVVLLKFFNLVPWTNYVERDRREQLFGKPKVAFLKFERPQNVVPRDFYPKLELTFPNYSNLSSFVWLFWVVTVMVLRESGADSE